MSKRSPRRRRNLGNRGPVDENLPPCLSASFPAEHEGQPGNFMVIGQTSAGKCVLMNEIALRYRSVDGPGAQPGAPSC